MLLFTKKMLLFTKISKDKKIFGNKTCRKMKKIQNMENKI